MSFLSKRFGKKRSDAMQTASKKAERKHKIIESSPSGTIQLIVATPSEMEMRYRELNREATALTDSDIQSAIAKLFEAKLICEEHDIDSGIERRLRLPLFLQRGGRFDEAMIEFNHLLDTTDFRVDHFLSSGSSLHKLANKHLESSKIYDKMRLACKREKRKADADYFAAKSTEHRAAWDELQPIIDAEREAESKAYELKVKKHRERRLNRTK